MATASIVSLSLLVACSALYDLEGLSSSTAADADGLHTAPSGPGRVVVVLSRP